MQVEMLESRLLLHGAGLDVDTIVGIEIDGETQTVPAGIGQLFSGNLDIFTDDASGTIRYESGNTDNATLDDFFANWDRTILENGGPFAGNPSHETRCRLIGAHRSIVVDGQPASSDFSSISLNDVAHIDIHAFTGGPVSTTAPSSGGLFAPVTLGAFDDPGLFGVRTDLLPGAPAITSAHVNGNVAYGQDPASPPTYGDHHWTDQFDIDTNPGVTPRLTGIYDNEQPDEDLVHNLDSGHVWISYNPNLISDSELADLKQLLRDGAGNDEGSGAGVILTPRAANDHAIELASWGRLLELHHYNEPTIRSFIETNRGHAPDFFVPATAPDPNTVPVTFTDDANLMVDTGPIDANAPTLFMTTDTGLRYRILRDSAGTMPTATDFVSVDYRGWLDDGTVFDESYPNATPSTFSLTSVIAGWTEGLQLVGEGGMIELWIPSELGYGSAGTGNIPPNARLHFIVELIDVL
jgi:FKBP-type peptidyl-prolyl cis-trans isomerase FkpA